MRTVARRVRHGEGDDESIDELIEQLVIEERGDSELDVLNAIPPEDRKIRVIHRTCCSVRVLFYVQDRAWTTSKLVAL